MIHRHNFLLLLTVLLGTTGTVVAQNLIADPGFEIWDGTIGANPNTLGGLTHWYEASGTSDHHHQLNPSGSNLTSLEDCPTGNGRTECGEPYEGQGVLGCWKGNGADGSREWAGIELSEPMVAGGCYEISFWIQNKKDEPGDEYISNQWGIFFDHTEIPFFNPNLANYAAMADHWVACEEVIDGSEWIKLEFDYQASEDFKYAYIGYMGDFSTSTYSVANTDHLLGYYVWIDEVIVNHIDPQLTLTDDISICAGDSVTLEALSNFPIRWEDNDSAAASRSVSPQATTTYYVQTQDSTLCSVRDSVTVTVVGGQVIDFEADLLQGCPPLEVQFDDLSPVAGIAYEWSFGNGTHSNDLFATTAVYTEAGIYDVELEVIYSEHCKNTLLIPGLIEVLEPPVADFTYAPLALSNLDPVAEFQHTSTGTIAQAFWDFGNGMTSRSLNPQTTFDLPGVYEVFLEVTASNGCTDSTSHEIRVNNEIKVFAPNVFSPNQDGRNDSFQVFLNGQVGDYEIVIFDRWGSPVYESSDIHDAWDGRLPDGRDCGNGVYVYVISYRYQGLHDAFIEEQKAGDVTLLR